MLNNIGHFLGKLWSKSRIFIMILLAFILLFMLYCWAIQPLLCYLNILEPIVHQGVYYYEEERYLEFEAGDRFQQMLVYIPGLSSAEVLDFYHEDGHPQDNPIRGKKWDIFVLEAAVKEKNLPSIIESISGTGKQVFTVDDYTVYYMPSYKTACPDDGVLLALSERSGNMKVFFVSDAKDPLDSIVCFYRLTEISYIKWNTKKALWQPSGT